MRCLHELSYHDSSSFVTLTYNDDSLPDNSSLRKRDLQLFFKRLRKAVLPARIRYFACGEYGDDSHRPHYHILLFGHGLSAADKLVVMKSWPYCDWNVPAIAQRAFGVVEHDSIQYVAKYIDKQLTGELAEQEYFLQNREPVFRLMSQGLGRQYVADHAQQLSDDLCVRMCGVKLSLPRYYVRKLDIDSSILTEKALESEREIVEHHTNIYIDKDALYASSNNELYIKMLRSVEAARQQSDVNLKARVKLKKRTL